MPTLGGLAQRLTFQDASCRISGGSPGGDEVLYTGNARQFAHRFEIIYAMSPNGGLPRQLPIGMANAISYGPRGGIVLGRNINIREMSHQKRYRGGRVGHLWFDTEGTGIFQRLLQLEGNIADVGTETRGETEEIALLTPIYKLGTLFTTNYITIFSGKSKLKVY